MFDPNWVNVTYHNTGDDKIEHIAIATYNIDVTLK
jgi:hypothetical protein